MKRISAHFQGHIYHYELPFKANPLPFFFHPDYNCRRRSFNGSVPIIRDSRTIPPVGNFTLP